MLSFDNPRWRVALLIVCMLLAIGPADATTKLLSLEKKDAHWQFKDASKPPDQKEDTTTLKVSVKGVGAPSDTKMSVKYTGGDGKEGDTALALSGDGATKQTWTASVALKDLDVSKDVWVEGTVETDNPKGPTWKLVPAAAPPAAPPQSLLLSELDVEALEWWHADGRSGAERAKLPKDGTSIVHLPSGTPASLIPSDLREPARVAVFVMVAKDERQRPRTDLNLQSCPGVVPFRTTGDVKDFAGVLQGKAIDFLLVPLGAQLKCGAGTLAYNIVITSVPKGAQAGAPEPSKGSASQPEATTTSVSIRIRPVYHLLVSGFYGFDGAKEPSFSATNGKIAKQEDSFGLGFGLGFVWAPFGVDYENMQWYNYFLNPYIAFSTNHPADNIYVGLASTVTGGISLALGASFHHITTLSGVKEGDAFSGPGQIPTSKSWSKDGVGFYIGLALDKNVLGLVKGFLGK
jgi:hypothetical protein